jgi:hypothetical protein
MQILLEPFFSVVNIKQEVFRCFKSHNEHNYTYFLIVIAEIAEIYDSCFMSGRLRFRFLKSYELF